MESDQSGLVDLVRDLLAAYQATRRVTSRYRSGELRFEELKTLVGDSEGTVLFRLKERCHALFRPVEDDEAATVSPAVLFDLAVGSLFHEAMKLRENFYQREVYGPKVRAARHAAVGDELREKLVREMEKIVADASQRLDEAVHETETLLSQTRDQFRSLLVVHRENGLVVRYLIENASLVAEVFEEGLDSLLEEIFGDTAGGYQKAARSYLQSGYFDEARGALSEAVARAGERPDLLALVAYAEGMSAYLRGSYGESVDRLGCWIEAGPAGEDAAYADLAYAAMSRLVRQLGDADPELLGETAALLARIQPHSPRACA